MDYVKGYKNWKSQVFEQEESGLPTVSFNKSFLDNMVSLRETPELQQALAQLDSSIQKAKDRYKDKGKVSLKSLSITVNSGASEVPATNRLGTAESPDHSYGNRVPAQYWVARSNPNYKTRALTLNLNNLPSELNKYDKTKGHLTIEGGNAWLAEQRGIRLEKYLNAYLRKKYPSAEITIKRNDANSSSTKYASAVIDGIVYAEDAPGTPPKEYKWLIKYPWFKFEGSNKPYAYLSNQLLDEWKDLSDLRYRNSRTGNFEPEGTPKGSFVSAVESSDNRVTAAGYRFKKSSRAVGEDLALQIAFTRISGWVDADGITFYYDNEEEWLNEVSKLEKISNFVDKNKKYEKGKSGSADFQVKPNFEGFRKDGSVPLTLLKPSSKKDEVVGFTQVKRGEDTKPEGSTKAKPSVKS